MAVETLINELAADLEGYETNRAFPREVSLDEAAEVAGFLHDQVDQGTEVRAHAIATAGAALACGRGCNACCAEPIMVLRPEAARVAHWLALPENAEERARFLAAYPAWSAAIGETVEQLAMLYFSDPDHYIVHHGAAWRKNVMCAFNRDGDCSIYPVRPVVCRNSHALDTAEHCRPDSGKMATRATFVPLDQFLAKARRLLRATHNATAGDRWIARALPLAVYEMLESRNTEP